MEDLYSTRADTAIRREPVRIAFERPLPPVEQETVQKLEFGRGQPLVYLTELECSPVSQAPEGDHNTLRTTVRMKLVYQDESGSPVSAERTAEVSAPMSAAAERGLAATFFISDADMWGHYWWDNERYPQCDGSLPYSALTEEPSEPEPETSPDAVSPSPSPSEEPDAENSQSP